MLAVVLLHGDEDAVARADVVQQEIAVGMECLVAERVGNGEFSTIHGCTRGCGGQRRDMADVAANFGEQRFAFLGPSGGSLSSVARRSFGSAHEAREVIDIRKAVCAGFVVRFGYCIAQVGHFVGKQRVGNSHFVEVGIARE